MTPEETLEALYSLDNYQASSGAWEIVRADNAFLDKAFLPYIDKIRSAVNSLPKPRAPNVREIRDIVKVALNILELRHKNMCRCNIYPNTNQLLPSSQAKYGLVEILESKACKETWESVYSCKCKFCKQEFIVTENHNYHYPWSAWKKL